MDRGAWWAIVHGVPKSRAQLSNQHITHFGPDLTETSCLDLNEASTLGDANTLRKKKEVFPFEASTFSFTSSYSARALTFITSLLNSILL